MRYLSTRGTAPVLDFEGALLAGLAADGGLYVPTSWPRLNEAEWRDLRGRPYHEVAAALLRRFAPDQPDLAQLVEATYADWGHPAVAPLVQLGPRTFVLELHHGPTLAFKDMAMRLLAALYGQVLTARNERVTILGATSGDTGAAAVAAFAGSQRAQVVMLHPEGRISPVQRRQMTTWPDPNLHNLAVRGTFDDCQDLVKALFADPLLRRDANLTAVNSINWARVAAQVPYYAYAALALGAPDREVAFSVPTGNFGNVLAAWVARAMGLPIARLIVASNANDILARFLSANDMSVRGVVPTLAPSMDIQVSSNFERLVFELLGRDPDATRATMTAFRTNGRMAMPASAWHEATALFHGFAADDRATLAEIARTHAETGYLADPHTAIGLAAARVAAPEDPGIPVVALATAHPAKFAPAVADATGIVPHLPARLADLMERPERCATLPADPAAIASHIRSQVLQAAQ